MKIHKLIRKEAIEVVDFKKFSYNSKSFYVMIHKERNNLVTTLVQDKDRTYRLCPIGNLISPGSSFTGGGHAICVEALFSCFIKEGRNGDTHELYEFDSFAEFLEWISERSLGYSFR